VANVVIYYQTKETEKTEEAIEFINNLIQQLETNYVIKGVFIDNLNERNEFYELLNSPLNEIDIIFLEKPLEDEFDKKLLFEVAKMENIHIKYFGQI
jgi:pantothenate kinase